jgi:hypothetical protein
MCLQLMRSLVTLSDFKGCFSRSDKSLASTRENDSSQEDLLSWPGRVRRSNATISSRDYVIAAGHTSACVCHACLSQVRTACPSNTKDQWSSESSSPRSSIRSVSGKPRIRLKRSWSSWRSQHSDDAEPADDSIDAEVEDTTIYGLKPDSALIAELDALSLSQYELELLRRMEQVCESARAARERRHGRFELENDHIQRRSALSEIDSDVELEPRLRLRGGGDDDELPVCGGRRRRTTLPPVPPKPGSTRPHAVKWWLAGGRRSREGKVPTVGELRVRREVELANRKIVGFWGTVLGFRRVGKVGILQDDDVGGGDKGSDGMVERDEGDAASVAAVGAGDGGSVVSSKGERGIDVEDPGEAKADITKDAVEDQAEAEAVNAEEAARDPPEARAESAKSVLEDNATREAEGKAEAARAEHP